MPHTHFCLQFFIFYYFDFRTTTEKIVANDEAFLVCSDDSCFDPTIIEEEINQPDLNAAASARLPDDNLRLIFEQMALRQNQVLLLYFLILYKFIHVTSFSRIPYYSKMRVVYMCINLYHTLLLITRQTG